MQCQRSAVIELLITPVRQLARQCEDAWPNRESLTEVLLQGFDSIPYCTMKEISLTFSCDGSHYMPCDEFLDKDASLWFGSS